MVKIFSDDFMPFMYEFAEPLLGGVTYTRTIEAPNAVGQPQQAVRQGYLLVKVTPPTARLTMDGTEYEAKDGLVKVLLRNGNYTYRVEAPGYFPSDGSVTIDGQTVTQEVAMRSSKPQLSVRSTTPGTQIYVNGELRGTGSVDCEVVKGLNEVEERVDGHRSYAQTIELAEGERREVVIPALTPVMGALNVDYEPVGAKVSLDGREVGVSPMVLNDVLAGTHTVVVSASEYETTTLTATVKEGETAQLYGKLNKDEKELVTFWEGRKVGFKDENGQVVIEPKYDWARSFTPEGGLAKVELNGKYGFVDKTGRVVIPLKYNNAYSFKNERAQVELNGEWFFIDKKGNRIE